MSYLNKVNILNAFEYEPTVKQELGYVGQDCIAGVFSTFTHSWLASGEKLFIVNNSDGSLLSSWTFGEHSTEQLDITCVIELPFEGCSLPLLVIGISSENTSQICFFNPNTRKILRTIDVDYPVRTLCIVEYGLTEVNPINDALTKTQGLFAVGCADGSILILDLCREILLKALSGDFGFLSDEENPVEIVCINVSAITTAFVERKLKDCYSKQNNLAVQLSDGTDDGITSLCYSFESAILIVGTSGGSFILWNMSSLTNIFKSKNTGRPIISLSLLEPCDDPRHNLYLWICYENHPQVVMYCMGFGSKYFVPGYGVYYQGFENTGLVYRLYLGQDENLVAKRPISSQAFAKTVTKNLSKSLNIPECDSYQLRLFLTSYEVLEKGQISNRALVFDLNQWYKEQMPDEGFSTCIDVVPVEGSSSTVWHLAIDSSSVTHYQSVRPLEQHFHPSSLDFKIWSIEEEGICCFEKLGLQSHWLRNMTVVGPAAVLKPTSIFQGAVSAGLLPMFSDPPDPEYATNDEERKYILTVCLENRLQSVIETCAEEWTTGSHPVAGCTIPFIIEWLWELHGFYKTQGNKMCVPLFDHSGLGFDFSEKRALQQCKFLLCAVETLYKTILRKFGSFVLVDGIEQKFTAMALLRFYFDCCLKLIAINLLPEPNDSGKPSDSLAYKYNEIADFVESKRKQGPFLGDSLIGRTGGESQWEEEGGNGRYPPPSIQSVLRYCLHPAPPKENKLSLMLYLYMDVLHSHKPIRDLSNFDKIINFQYLLRIPDVQYKIITSFWLLDHSLFEEGLNVLIDSRVLTADLKDDQHRDILSLLSLQGQEKLALQYLRLKAPPLHEPNDIRLELDLLLSNRLINEAFMFQRKHTEHRESLLIQFFQGCISKKLLGLVFGLHLDPKEESVLLKFLKTSELKEKGDLQVLLLLSRAKYTEAISLNDRLNSTMNGPKARLGTVTRDMIVRGVTGSLNPISRRMECEMRKYRPPPPGTCPIPLSALIKIRSEPDGPLCQADSQGILSAAAKSVRHLSDFMNVDGGKRKRDTAHEGEDMEVDSEDPPLKRIATWDMEKNVLKPFTSLISSVSSTPPKSTSNILEREVMELVGTPLVKKRGKKLSPHSRPSSILKGKTPERGLVIGDQDDTPRKTIRFALPENEKRVTGRKSLHPTGFTFGFKEGKNNEESEEKKLKMSQGHLKTSDKSSIRGDGGIDWKNIAESSKPRVLFTQGTGTSKAAAKNQTPPRTLLDISVSSAERKYLESPSRENEVSPVTEAVFNMTVPKRLFSVEDHECSIDSEVENIQEKYLSREAFMEKYRKLRNKNLSPFKDNASSGVTVPVKSNLKTTAETSQNFLPPQQLKVENDQQPSLNEKPTKNESKDDVPKGEKSTNENLIISKDQIIDNVPKREKSANENLILSKDHITDDVPKGEKSTNENLIVNKDQITDDVPKGEKSTNENLNVSKDQIIDEIQKDCGVSSDDLDDKLEASDTELNENCEPGSESSLSPQEEGSIMIQSVLSLDASAFDDLDTVIVESDDSISERENNASEDDACSNSSQESLESEVQKSANETPVRLICIDSDTSDDEDICTKKSDHNNASNEESNGSRNEISLDYDENYDEDSDSSNTRSEEEVEIFELNSQNRKTVGEQKKKEEDPLASHSRHDQELEDNIIELNSPVWPGTTNLSDSDEDQSQSVQDEVSNKGNTKTDNDNDGEIVLSSTESNNSTGVSESSDDNDDDDDVDDDEVNIYEDLNDDESTHQDYLHLGLLDGDSADSVLMNNSFSPVEIATKYTKKCEKIIRSSDRDSENQEEIKANSKPNEPGSSEVGGMEDGAVTTLAGNSETVSSDIEPSEEQNPPCVDDPSELSIVATESFSDSALREQTLSPIEIATKYTHKCENIIQSTEPGSDNQDECKAHPKPNEPGSSRANAMEGYAVTTLSGNSVTVSSNIEPIEEQNPPHVDVPSDLRIIETESFADDVLREQTFSPVEIAKKYKQKCEKIIRSTESDSENQGESKTNSKPEGSDAYALKEDGVTKLSESIETASAYKGICKEQNPPCGPSELSMIKSRSLADNEGSNTTQTLEPVNPKYVKQSSSKEKDSILNVSSIIKEEMSSKSFHSSEDSKITSPSFAHPCEDEKQPLSKEQLVKTVSNEGNESSVTLPMKAETISPENIPNISSTTPESEYIGNDDGTKKPELIIKSVCSLSDKQMVQTSSESDYKVLKPHKNETNVSYESSELLKDSASILPSGNEFKETTETSRSLYSKDKSLQLVPDEVSETNHPCTPPSHLDVKNEYCKSGETTSSPANESSIPENKNIHSNVTIPGDNSSLSEANFKCLESEDINKSPTKSLLYENTEEQLTNKHENRARIAEEISINTSSHNKQIIEKSNGNESQPGDHLGSCKDTNRSITQLTHISNDTSHLNVVLVSDDSTKIDPSASSKNEIIDLNIPKDKIKIHDLIVLNKSDKPSYTSSPTDMIKTLDIHAGKRSSPEKLDICHIKNSAESKPVHVLITPDNKVNHDLITKSSVQATKTSPAEKVVIVGESQNIGESEKFIDVLKASDNEKKNNNIQKLGILASEVTLPEKTDISEEVRNIESKELVDVYETSDKHQNNEKLTLDNSVCHISDLIKTKQLEAPKCIKMDISPEIESTESISIVTQVPKTANKDEISEPVPSNENTLTITEIRPPIDIFKDNVIQQKVAEKTFFFGNNDNDTYLRASRATFQVGSRPSLPNEDEPINPMEVAMIEEVADEGEMVEEEEEDDPRNTCMLDVDLSLQLSEDEVVQNEEPKKMDKSIVTTDSYLQRKLRRRSRRIEASTKGSVSEQVEVDKKSINTVSHNDKQSFSTQTSDSLLENDDNVPGNIETKSISVQSETTQSTKVRQVSDVKHISDSSSVKEKTSRKSSHDVDVKGILKNKNQIKSVSSDCAKDLRVQATESSDESTSIQSDADAILKSRARRSSYKKSVEDKDARTDPYEIVENVQKNKGHGSKQRSSIITQNSEDATDLRIKNDVEDSKTSKRYSKDPEYSGILKKVSAYDEMRKVKRSTRISQGPETSTNSEKTSKKTEALPLDPLPDEKKKRHSTRKSIAKNEENVLAIGKQSTSLSCSMEPELKSILKKTSNKSSRRSYASENTSDLKKRLEEDFPDEKKDKKRSRRYSEEPDLHSVRRRTVDLHKKGRRTVDSLEVCQELKRQGTSSISETATDLRVRLEKDFPEDTVRPRRYSEETSIQGILKNKDNSRRRRSSHNSETATDLRLHPQNDFPEMRRRSVRRRSVDVESFESTSKVERRSRRSSYSSEAGDLVSYRDGSIENTIHSSKSSLQSRSKEDKYKPSDQLSVDSEQATDLRLTRLEDAPDILDGEKSKKSFLISDNLPQKRSHSKRQRHSLSSVLPNEPKAKHRRNSLDSNASSDIKDYEDEDISKRSLKDKSHRQSRRSSISESDGVDIKSSRTTQHKTEENVILFESKQKASLSRTEASLQDLPSEVSPIVKKKKSHSLQDFPVRRSTRRLHTVLEDIKEEEEEASPRKKLRSFDDLDVIGYRGKSKLLSKKKDEPKAFPPLVIAESDSELDATPIKDVWNTEGYAKERRLTRNQKNLLMKNQQLLEEPSPSPSTSSPRRQSRRKTPVPESPPRTPTRSSLRLQKKPPSESDDQSI